MRSKVGYKIVPIHMNFPFDFYRLKWPGSQMNSVNKVECFGEKYVKSSVISSLLFAPESLSIFI